MPNLNVKFPEDLYARVRLAAACGGSRIPRGALERFVHEALKRMIAEPTPGYGMPKLKLCAGCVKANQEAFTRPKAKVAPMTCAQVRPTVISEDVEGPMVRAGVFSHLIDLPAPVEIPAMIAEPRPRTLKDQMAEVCPGIWVGSDLEFSCCGDVGVRVSYIGAAKDPWHRQMVGYKTKSAPEGPQRLVARNGNYLALNLIDVRELGPGQHDYIPDEVVEKALAFIDERLEAGDQVLIHDPQGESAAPGIALLYMHSKGLLEGDPLTAFAQLYRNFLPHAGMKAYIQRRLAGDSHALTA